MQPILTIDIHKGDSPADVGLCLENLSKTNTPATFFIPTGFLRVDPLGRSLRKIDTGFHEIASHTHFHNRHEMEALKSPKISGMEFLSESMRRIEDFFHVKPISFRSPCWVRPSDSAYRYLFSLGYRIDSSATPQRIGLFSSFPKENPWLSFNRNSGYLPGGILEVPTSCFVFPLASPTFLTFGTWFAKIFLKALALEANVFDRPLVIQAHVSDFGPAPFAFRGTGFKNAIRFRNAKKMGGYFPSLLKEMGNFKTLVSQLTNAIPAISSAQKIPNA